MPQQQEMKTDRLVSVIQTIQLGRRTGTLQIWRGEGAQREEGNITFANGRVMESQVGWHKGPEAFNQLSLWEICSFVFTSANPQDQPLFFSQPPPQMSPAPGIQTPPPFVPVSPLRTHAAPPPPTTEPLRPQQQLPQSSPLPTVVIPYQTRQLNSALRTIENLKLSRIHRQILLLIDGQRSNADLERLTGRNPGEILKILQDLEHATVIRLQREPFTR